VGRCVFVGDAGMVSAENLTALARAGGTYIVCISIHRSGEIAHEVVTRPRRYQEVSEDLVKDIIVVGGECRRRHVGCYNPQVTAKRFSMAGHPPQ
jgi:hypothetical protein